MKGWTVNKWIKNALFDFLSGFDWGKKNVKQINTETFTLGI